MRIGIAGCGKVAHLHAAALQSIGHPVTACTDTNTVRAAEFASRWDAKAFRELSEMLPHIDVLSVCTPHPLHADAVVQAARMGVHALVEKPLASSLQDCDRMIEAAAKAGTRLNVISQRRFYEPVLRMRKAIDDGRIGRPVLGTMQMLSWRDEAYYASDPWRGTWAGEGGGVLVNQSPHQFDILLWLMGEVVEVSAYWANLNHPYIEVEDTAVASLRFRGGALGSIITSVSQRPGIYSKVHIHGSNGASVGVQTDTGATFVAGMSGIAEPPFTDVWTIPGEEHRLDEFLGHDRECFSKIDATYHYHAMQWERFIKEEGASVSAAEGRAVVELFTAIYRSNNESKPVRLPL